MVVRGIPYAVCNSRARKVAFPILDPIVFPSTRVIPFYTKPYTNGSINFPYIQDGPGIAGVDETSAQRWKDACSSVTRRESSCQCDASGRHTTRSCGPGDRSRSISLAPSTTFEVRTCASSLECRADFSQQLEGRMLSPDTWPPIHHRPTSSMRSGYLHTSRAVLNRGFQPLVRFEENLAVRRFVLNRPGKLNAINAPMFEALARQIEVCIASHYAAGDVDRHRIFFPAMGKFRAVRGNCGNWCWQGLLRRR